MQRTKQSDWSSVGIFRRGLTQYLACAENDRKEEHLTKTKDSAGREHGLTPEETA